MHGDSPAPPGRPHLRIVPDPRPQDPAAGADAADPDESPVAAGWLGHPAGGGRFHPSNPAHPSNPMHPSLPPHPSYAAGATHPSNAPRPEVEPDPKLMAALPPAMLALMDELTTTMFCLKDAHGRYVAVNPTFVLRTNQRSARDVLGRTAAELFVPELAQRYEEQDARVMSTGKPLHNELELIVAPGGVPRWHLTAKVPLRAQWSEEDSWDECAELERRYAAKHAKQAKHATPATPRGAQAPYVEPEPPVIGIVSMSQDLGQDAVDDPAMTSLHEVVHYIDHHLAGTIRTADLARVAGCSPDTLERRVRRVFHRSPKQLVLTARIDAARSQLAQRGTPIVTIAQRCGFYDQAAFSRTFARLTGLTPSQYRRRATRR